MRAASLLEGTSNVASALLEYADSSITYRRRYFSEPRLSSTLELLLADPGNPRSLAFQLEVLQEHARDLPATQSGVIAGSLVSLADRLAGKALEWVSDGCGQDMRDGLKKTLEELRSDLNSIAEEITKQYFCHTVSHRVEALS